MCVVAALPSAAASASGAWAASVTQAATSGSGATSGLEPEITAGPVPELSTEISNTVRNEDGSYTAKIAAGPINYQDESGEWVPISNELVEAPGAAYAVENEANSYTVSIPENPAVTPVRFETDDAWLKMKMAGSDEAEAVVEGSEATFEDVAPSADEVSYQATDSGVKEIITLDTAPQTAVNYVFNLSLSPGVTPVLTAQNTVEFRDGSGATKFVMPVPNMEDSATPEPAYTNDATYSLAPQGTGWKLTVTPDLGWLSDPARVYPVAIDPTVDKYNQKDCWIQSDMPSSNRCYSEVIRAGRVSGGTRRGLLDFGVDSVPAGATISSATLYLHLLAHESSGNGGATGFSLYQPSQRWSAAATWNHSGITSWNGGSSGAKLSNDVVVMGGQGDWGWKGWNVTNTVDRWRLSPSNGDYLENRGFMVRQESESVSKGVGFVGATSYGYSVYRPILRIDYTDQNSLGGPSVTVIETEVYNTDGTFRSSSSHEFPTGSSDGQDLPPGVVGKIEKGSGGESSASGCQTATLKNKKFSYSGTDHLYTYTTYTSWCWNRAAKQISNVGTGYRQLPDNSSVIWRGEVLKELHFYSWSPGNTSSGYYHYRQGSFENCYPITGCIGSSHPENIIRSHSDGTYTWWTND